MSDLKLGQVELNGNQHLVIVNNLDCLVVTDERAPSDSLQLIQSCTEEKGLHALLTELLTDFQYTNVGNVEALLSNQSKAHCLKPINPPEVWAVGVTYKRQAREHDIDLEKRTGSTEELYYRVYANHRAEVFFKGFDRSCSGPGEEITLRADSKQVMPEAEMVSILGASGLPVAFTGGNDLTAWDIELDCPLYLNQAKIWSGSGSFGPFIVPVEDFRDPYAKTVGIEVFRDGEKILESSGSTSELKRSLEELCYWLTYNNQVQPGSLLFTGTGCVIPHDFSLQHKDLVNVFVEDVGELSNPVRQLSEPQANYQKR